ncbi:hypothetical protein ACFQ41_04760 [Lacticaseibacillus suilingensis]|uniref:DUF1642 domain-containing protein n=1 Tax=Lacticaseibacillus suilingensis TaxID=2799577 RepID=A0ABW4BFT3_9LACO|nr:hypothetical protein [Lacticaseibacillus suilingensis]
MSNETKREVFTRVNKFARELRVYDSELMESKKEIDRDYQEDMSAYDAALPDYLPVLPKVVSDAVKFYWTTYGSEKGLTDLLFDLVEPWRISVDKVVSAIHEDLRKHYLLHSDVIARAWVLGVWRVEETGEIVKLEAED